MPSGLSATSGDVVGDLAIRAARTLSFVGPKAGFFDGAGPTHVGLWRAVDIGEDGSFTCPPPSGDYLPSCWRAGELLRERCLEVGEDEDECAARAVLARQNYVDAFQAGWKTLPGHETGSWRNAGQAPDEMFQPAFNYRPLGSAQYMLAIRDFEAVKKANFERNDEL